MSRASSSTLRRIMASDSAIPGARSARRSSRWTEAMTGVRGVRSSCESVARNRSFAAFASSARWRAASSDLAGLLAPFGHVADEARDPDDRSVARPGWERG